MIMVARYLNAIYSVFSYGIKRYGGISTDPPLPPAISVELSSRCNLRCPECVTGRGLLQRKNGFIDFELARKIAVELSGRTLSAWLYFQGEPMLHPRFHDIVGLFSEMNPVISTNGHFLDEENCRRLALSALRKVIIPYDGTTPDAYGIYRIGGDHEGVTAGIKRLARVIREVNSGLKIEIQFLLHRQNETEAVEASAFAKSVHADFRIKSMQVLDIERAGDWMPSDVTRSRYVSAGCSWKQGLTHVRGCLRMWTTPVVTADGDVVPCCYDKFAVHKMGNLNDQTFSEIWWSEKYSTFRNTVTRNRASVNICAQCPQGKRVLFRQ